MISERPALVEPCAALCSLKRGALSKARGRLVKTRGKSATLHKEKEKRRSPQHLNAPDLLFLEIARKPEPPPGSARASLGGLGWVSRCAFWRLWRCKFRQSRDRETAHLSSDRDRGATAPSSRPRRCSVRPPLQFPRHRAVVTSTLRRVHSSRPVAPVVLVQRHQPATHHPARPAAPRRAPLPSARPPVSPSPRRLVNATARG